MLLLVLKVLAKQIMHSMMECMCWGDGVPMKLRRLENMAASCLNAQSLQCEANSIRSMDDYVSLAVEDLRHFSARLLDPQLDVSQLNDILPHFSCLTADFNAQIYRRLDIAEQIELICQAALKLCSRSEVSSL